MKNFIMAIAMLLAFACNNNIMPSNTSYQNREIVNEKGSTILVGRIAPFILKQGIYEQWFKKMYSEYIIDSSITKQLTPLLKNKTIEIFLGTWCGDSRREVPRMLKILDGTGFDTTRLKLITVDYTVTSYKQSPQHEERGKNIHRVPTFIVYDKNKEIGRIIETPHATLETDILSILNNEKYIPKYSVILNWQKINGRNKFYSDEQLEHIAKSLKPHCSSPSEFNGYGYMLFSENKRTEAGNVFRLNTFLFPTRPGVFSSLGEYYFLTGDKPAAKKCYEKVLQLKPDDDNAKKILAEF